QGAETSAVKLLIGFQSVYYETNDFSEVDGIQRAKAAGAQAQSTEQRKVAFIPRRAAITRVVLGERLYQTLKERHHAVAAFRSQDFSGVNQHLPFGLGLFETPRLTQVGDEIGEAFTQRIPAFTD